jgi:hypothetical protein
VERRDGAWRIAHRDAVYDMGGFAYPFGAQGVEDVGIAAGRHPREYAALACLLERGGHPVPRTCPVSASGSGPSSTKAARGWSVMSDKIQMG